MTNKYDPLKITAWQEGFARLLNASFAAAVPQAAAPEATPEAATPDIK